MSVAVDEILAAGHELAQLYREAVDELNRHWPDEDGVCIGCGDTYPCAEEWITERAITGIEARWRRQGLSLVDIDVARAADSEAVTNQTPAPDQVADQPTPQEEK